MSEKCSTHRKVGDPSVLGKIMQAQMASAMQILLEFSLTLPYIDSGKPAIVSFLLALINGETGLSAFLEPTVSFRSDNRLAG